MGEVDRRGESALEQLGSAAGTAEHPRAPAPVPGRGSAGLDLRRLQAAAGDSAPGVPAAVRARAAHRRNLRPGPGIRGIELQIRAPSGNLPAASASAARPSSAATRSCTPTTAPTRLIRTEFRRASRSPLPRQTVPALSERHGFRLHLALERLRFRHGDLGRDGGDFRRLRLRAGERPGGGAPGDARFLARLPAGVSGISDRDARNEPVDRHGPDQRRDAAARNLPRSPGPRDSAELAVGRAGRRLRHGAGGLDEPRGRTAAGERVSVPLLHPRHLVHEFAVAGPLRTQSARHLPADGGGAAERLREKRNSRMRCTFCRSTTRTDACRTRCRRK